MDMKEDYLPKDVERGRLWYYEHQDHVQRLLKSYGGRAFPMSGSDIAHPELWKVGAWKWFLEKIKKGEL